MEYTKNSYCLYEKTQCYMMSIFSASERVERLFRRFNVLMRIADLQAGPFVHRFQCIAFSLVAAE